TKRYSGKQSSFWIVRTARRIGQFIPMLDAYVRWYNEKRIKLSLGSLSPLEYRQHLGMLT
ncbi:IS3 family transposase, partial [Acidithiobacillus caldus]|uniref:IS3 family transposase n=1 Tax=Acidithiobacillus caldus TaxID=33059 RepID=UPI000AE9758E